jgi:NADH-quinone oxidoreductase subunit K
VLFEQILFFIAGFGALAGALGVAILRNPFFSVLALVAHLIALAVLFLLLRADFLAAAQVVVYAGSVMVLYVFVVAYVGGSDSPLRPVEGGLGNAFGPLVAVAVFVELSIAVVGSSPSSYFRSRRPPSCCSWPRSARWCCPARGGAWRISPDARSPATRDAGLMNTSWFVVLSAFIFCVGATGVMSRRSPLVVLLCLELMLNAGNLALVAFARMLGNEEGQIFALIVVVVAACEVVIGLGIIVGMFRRRLPIDVDQMTELRG